MHKGEVQILKEKIQMLEQQIVILKKHNKNHAKVIHEMLRIDRENENYNPPGGYGAIYASMSSRAPAPAQFKE